MPEHPAPPDPAAIPGTLVQQWLSDPVADSWGRRVLADGRVEECSSVTAAFEAGAWHFGSQPLAWRLITHLPPAALEHLRTVIRNCGVLDLSPEIKPTGTVIGGADQTWTIAVDDQHVHVNLLGCPLDRVAALATLNGALQLAMGEALSPQSDRR